MRISSAELQVARATQIGTHAMAIETFPAFVNLFRMGFFDRFFKRPMLFEMNPADVKMLEKARNSRIEPTCDCRQHGNRKLHSDVQDTGCEGWIRLLELVETAASRGETEFSPGLELSPELWRQIVTLPPSISKLKSVKKLYMYSSHLVRIPPEICEMTNLEELDLYTSYCLHWLPYEVTHCAKLKKSRISTRALYGNYKHRTPFPQLNTPESRSVAASHVCSLCRREFDPDKLVQAWISLRVGTDIVPLLVNACSQNCIEKLPHPAKGYVDRPHAGGPDLKQPPGQVVGTRPDLV